MAGQRLRIKAFSKTFLVDTHCDAPQSVGFLWTSDLLVADTLPDNKQH